MKYLDKKFSTPGNSRAFVEGWERCFGGDEKQEGEPVVVEEEPSKDERATTR